MTVCIAALSDNGEKVVIASDRMITVGAPLNIEFEHDRKKIDIIDKKFITMSAGDALIVKDVIDKTEDLIKNKPTADIESFGNYLRESYSNTRIKMIEEQLLQSINHTFCSFFAEGQKQMGQIFSQILQGIQNHNLGLELIAAGMQNDKARIGYIVNPGVLRWYDRLGFHAIGCGGIHATMSLIGHSFSTSCEETVKKVFFAKRNAEIAPGVGNQTDMMIISKKGITEIKQETFNELDQIYKESKQHNSVDLTKLREVLNDK